MTELGYALSSEEHGPRDLVRYARRAEEVGFSFALISDHYHPWVSRQGESPFVWTVLGGIARETERLIVGTGVTCPIMRIHPAIIAQAAATAAASMPGRFFLGVGTGENLNEHILGQRWPPPPVRLEMLDEAITILRELWKGESFSHRGRYFTVEEARLHTLPDMPPPIMVAASGKKAVELAARAGDGLIGLAPDREFIDRFERAGGSGKPTYGQLTVCWAPTDEEACRTAHEWWPTAALPGKLSSEVATPDLFESATELAREEDVADSILCSADPARHLEKLTEFVDAGFDHVYVHQVGPRQEDFFRFYEKEVLPEARFRRI
ncbi:MAG: TIGR03557 family F420-dependent LLM class oxidoreductase [Vicinamibacteria bacterium]